MYSLYWSRLPETDEGACTLASDNTSLRENPNCLFWSPCGIGNAADGHTDWVTLEANTGHVFEVRCTKTLWLVLASSQVTTCAAFPLARPHVPTSIRVRSCFATKPRNNNRREKQVFQISDKATRTEIDDEYTPEIPLISSRKNKRRGVRYPQPTWLHAFLELNCVVPFRSGVTGASRDNG